MVSLLECTYESHNTRTSEKYFEPWISKSSPEFYGSTDADGEYIFIVDSVEYGLFRGHCICVTLDWSHVTYDSFKLPQQQELWYS